jgi:maleylacetoacetate isomerase
MQIQFFYAEGANCCERVRWAMAFKRILCQAIDVEALPPDAPALHQFKRISPFGRVPVMLLDNTPLSESMAMVELLEELYPTPALTYTSALARAQVREICEAVNSSIHPIQNSSVVRTFRPDLSKADMQSLRANWISQNLAKLQNRLFLQSRFAVGAAFTLADIFIAVIYQKGVAMGGTRLPAFDAHWQFLMHDSAIRASCPLVHR